MPLRRILLISLSALFIISACQVGAQQAASTPLPTQPPATPTSAPPDPTSEEAAAQPTTVTARDEKRCGDGVCSGPENPQRCPQDCPPPSGELPSESDQFASPQAADNQAGQGVLYVGIMVHLEGWNDDANQQRFIAHAKSIREYADLFEKYGAKLTLESKEVTEGIHRWGDNVLLEMEQRGHGIGVHADLGGEKTYDCSQFASELRQRKQRLEELGVTVRHVSGNTSTCDWVTATADAGYLFTTGQVAYSVSSMPVDQRPPEYRNCPNPAACHDVFPTELADRIHPWRANSGADWTTPDPNGRLVILASSQGLKQMYEETHNQGTNKDMQFTAEDIDAYFDQLEQALALSTPDQVNIFYVSWSLGGELDRSLLEEWLKRLQPYIESGRVQWKTLPEMYEAFVRDET
jgi:hypothetical protein